MEVDDNMLELELMALPPLTPVMDRALSEAFADLSEMDNDDGPTVIKLETPALRHARIKAEHDADSMSLRMATPPSTSRNKGEVGGLSPSVKAPTVFKNLVGAKRARRSAIEKKSRHRRQEMLKRMRDEVEQLQDVYTKMIVRKEATAAAQVTQWNTLTRSDAPMRVYRRFPTASVNQLHCKYSELSVVAHALEDDQIALRELLQTHENFQQKVKSLTDERKAEQVLWNSGIPPSSSFSAHFRQHSADECVAIVRETYRELERFLEADNFETTGASFMGWTDKRRVNYELQALQFCFTKRFPLESADNLLTQTWNIFSNGDKMAEMSFDRSVRTRFEVLQVLNDNLIIIRRDHHIPSIPMTFFSVQMVFRLQTPMGYTMCSRTISAPEIERAKEPHEYFYNAFHWTRFNHLHDEFGKPAGCEVVTGGSINDQNQLQSRYWLFELICSVLRWESACVAPLLLKQM